MALFHFEISNSTKTIPCCGADLESLAAARETALQYAGALLADEKPSFWDGHEWTMSVSNAERITLFSVTITTTEIPPAGALN